MSAVNSSSRSIAISKTRRSLDIGTSWRNCSPGETMQKSGAFVTSPTRRPVSSNAFIKFTLLNLILLALEFGNRESNFVLGHADENEAAIELTRFLVPAQVKSGELRRLSCQFKLHGATLHAMKLFKDDQEFFRFTPSHQKMSFSVSGVQVDLGRSREGEVWLKINRRSGGQYKCQVLIEGTFKSVSLAKRMEVVAGGEPGASPTTVTGHSGPWQHHPVQQDPSTNPMRHPHLSRQAHSPVQQQHLYGATSSGSARHAHRSLDSPAAFVWSLLVGAMALAATCRRSLRLDQRGTRFVARDEGRAQV